jgi:hypothetical protein
LVALLFVIIDVAGVEDGADVDDVSGRHIVEFIVYGNSEDIALKFMAPELPGRHLWILAGGVLGEVGNPQAGFVRRSLHCAVFTGCLQRWTRKFDCNIPI